jgi:hypothetical protein
LAARPSASARVALDRRYAALEEARGDPGAAIGAGADPA